MPKISPEIYQLLFDPSNPAVIYAAINKSDAYNRRFNDAFLYKSVDGGNNWQPADTVSTEAFPAILTDLIITPSSPGTLYATSIGNGAGVYKRADGAGRWERISSANLPNVPNVVAVDPKVPGRLYLGFDPSVLPDVFVAKLNSAGSALIYSTNLGGIGVDGVAEIALDAGGNLYLMGSGGKNFPTTPGVFLTALECNANALSYVAKLKPDGRALAYSTYLGCGGIFGGGVDAMGNVHVVFADGFVFSLRKLNPDGTSLVYSKPLQQQGSVIGVRTSATGSTCVRTILRLPPINPIGTRLRVAFESVEYDSTGNATTNTCLAGGAMGARGNVYFVEDGYTFFSSGYEGRATPGVFQPNPGSQGGDAYVTRYSPVPGVQAASAANYRLTVASESLAVLFGTGLSRTTQAAMTTPLPTELAGVRVGVIYSGNQVRFAPLLFVSPTQVNFQLPSPPPSTYVYNPTDPRGMVYVAIDGEPIAAGAIVAESVAPGVFSANANGRGVAAAVVQRVRADGSQAFEPIASYDQSLRQFVAIPIDLGPETDQIFLVLFGTGWRFRSSESAVKVTMGGVDVPVTYAGLQPTLAGVDQINARLPRSLAGKGEVDLVVTVDGKVANAVRISFK